jgi:hypothetical protein
VFTGPVIAAATNDRFAAVVTDARAAVGTIVCGGSAFVLTPLTLIAKIAALVPPVIQGSTLTYSGMHPASVELCSDYDGLPVSTLYIRQRRLTRNSAIALCISSQQAVHRRRLGLSCTCAAEPGGKVHIRKEGPS